MNSSRSRDSSRAFTRIHSDLSELWWEQSQSPFEKKRGQENDQDSFRTDFCYGFVRSNGTGVRVGSGESCRRRECWCSYAAMRSSQTSGSEEVSGAKADPTGSCLACGWLARLSSLGAGWRSFASGIDCRFPSGKGDSTGSTPTTNDCTGCIRATTPGAGSSTSSLM